MYQNATCWKSHVAAHIKRSKVLLEKISYSFVSGYTFKDKSYSFVSGYIFNDKSYSFGSGYIFKDILYSFVSVYAVKDTTYFVFFCLRICF